MTARRLSLTLLVTTTIALAGCGGSGKPKTPDLSKLPLVDGAQIVAQATRCDQGANPFCAIELVVVDRHYRTSDALLKGEHDHLRSRGWTGANGDTGDEHAADSPGHRLHLTYATADGDLKGIDLGWIRRTRQTTLALSRALFQHRPALSMMLELGASTT